MEQLPVNHPSCGQSIALVDCNSFYASCERIFNPKLLGQPVIILSNNDGCIITRSNEAKKLGIKMGEPYFKVKKIIEDNNVQVFSSNYSLYGDISERVMETLLKFSPDVEIYSIDEAFLNFKGFKSRELNNYCFNIRNTIKKWIGIPVSIGVSSTKTLSKIANYLAKEKPELQGVCILNHEHEIKEALKIVDIKNIWGIGRKLSEFLNKQNIKTAQQFVNLNRGWIKKNMGVVGERIYMELKGISCLDLELLPSPRKSCCVSRSFSKPIQTIEELIESVATYGSRASEKIRKENITSQLVSVFILTNYFNKKDKQYSNSAKLKLDFPTNNSALIVKKAIEGVRHIFKKGYHYKKAGVILYGLNKTNSIRGLLDFDRERSEKLMKSIDKINFRYGSSTLRLAAEGTEKRWEMKREYKTPCYTTRFNELKTVRS